MSCRLSRENLPGIRRSTLGTTCLGTSHLAHYGSNNRLAFLGFFAASQSMTEHAGLFKSISYSIHVCSSCIQAFFLLPHVPNVAPQEAEFHIRSLRRYLEPSILNA